MKWYQSSFKSEAIWLMVLSFAPALLGLLILLLALLLRWLG